MSAFVKATQKPPVSKSVHSTFLCCFRSAEDPDNADVPNTPIESHPPSPSPFSKQNGAEIHVASALAGGSTTESKRKSRPSDTDSSDTDELSTADSFDERLAEVAVLRKADSIRRDSPQVLHSNTTTSADDTREQPFERSSSSRRSITANVEAIARVRTSSRFSAAKQSTAGTELEKDRVDTASRARSDSKPSTASRTFGSDAANRDRAESHASSRSALKPAEGAWAQFTPTSSFVVTTQSDKETKADEVLVDETVTLASATRREVLLSARQEMAVDVGVAEKSSTSFTKPQVTVTQPEAQTEANKPSAAPSPLTTEQQSAVATVTKATAVAAAAINAADKGRQGPVEIGKLHLSVTFDEKKSHLVVNVRELVNLLSNSKPGPAATLRGSQSQLNVMQLQDSDKYEVHITLLPAKQQRRRTSALPVRAARWNEVLRFDKVRAAKLREVGLRVRLYLIQANSRRASSILGSNPENVVCEAKIALGDYRITPGQPFDFTLTLSQSEPIAASTSDLTSASGSRHSIAMTTSTQNSVEVKPSDVPQARAVSMVNLAADTKPRSGSHSSALNSGSKRNSVSTTDLQNSAGGESPAHKRRSSSLLKMMRVGKSHSRAGSKSSEQGPAAADSSADELEVDVPIAEDRAGEAAAFRDAGSAAPAAASGVGQEREAAMPGPAVQLSLHYEGRIARLTVHLLQLNMGQSNPKATVKLTLLSKDGKEAASATTKKCEVAGRPEGLVGIDERFSFDLAQHRVSIDDVTIMLSAYAKKKQPIGWLALGANTGSSADVTAHWNAMRAAAGPSPSAAVVATGRIPRWHKLAAQ